MVFRFLFFCLLALTALAMLAGPVAAQEATVLLNASPSVIMADGRSSTTITATISGLNAEQVPDGTIVRFTTTSGTLQAQAVASVGGIARITLTSSPVPGYATITATFVGSNGSGSGQFKVEFTSDKTIANTDEGDSDWIRISSSDYLAYSADSLVVDASAGKEGVRFSYRGLVVTADALQADISTGTIRARNAQLQRDHKNISLMLFSYNITSGEGQGLSDTFSGSKTIQAVSFEGASLNLQSLPRDQLQSSPLQFVDISGSRVIVTASAVAIKMNDKIQLRRASIFVDSKHIVSMPYQIMPLNNASIFGQQVVGYGSDGLFLDVPYYASVSPKSTGAFYLRSTSAAQQDGTYYSGRQGLAVDYVEKYGSFDGKTTGTLNLMGISRGDWGAAWTHSEQLTNTLHGYFYVDIPNHNSVFASSNLVQQMHGYSLNFTSSEEHSPVQDGYSSSQQNLETYIQTDSHTLAGSKVHGLFYSEGLTMQDSMMAATSPGSSSKSWVTTKSAGLNVFTSPFRFGTTSQLTDSVNLSQAESNGGQPPGMTARAELNLNTKINSMASTAFSYSFSHDPVNGNLLNNPLLPEQFKPVSNQENYGLTFNLSPKNNKWSALLSSTYSQPLGDSSLVGGLSFYPTSNWILSANESYSEYAGIAFTDLELSIGRRIGSREVQLYWSTVDDRFRFDLGSAQF